MIAESWSLPSASGLHIAGKSWYAESAATDETVLVVPPFGATVEHLTVLFKTLARAFTQVAAFDPTNHTGASSGDVFDYSLTGTVDDIAVVADSVRPDVLIGMSLSARACLRYLASSESTVRECRLGMPVVDVRETIDVASGEPTFAQFEDSGQPGSFVRTWSGLEVGCRFFRDVLEHEWGGANATADELAVISVPVVAVAGSEDAWVRLAETERIFGPDLTTIRTSTHEVLRQPIQAVRLFRSLSRSGHAETRFTDMMSAKQVENE